jgi:hypothetical protein
MDIQPYKPSVLPSMTWKWASQSGRRKGVFARAYWQAEESMAVCWAEDKRRIPAVARRNNGVDGWCFSGMCLMAYVKRGSRCSPTSLGLFE